jgi:hypothetical protein
MLLASRAVAYHAEHYVISTFAGGARPRKPARAVDISLPFRSAGKSRRRGAGVTGSPPVFGLRAVATDTSGNLYVASDEGIRKLSASGGSLVISKATPLAIAVDDSGNIFLAEYGRAKKMRPDARVVTVAGNGTAISV